jgi:GNAT superfamily N-acetyltransferase
MVTVRPAVPADADEVVRINVRSWQQAYAGIVPDDVLAALDQQVGERVRRARERISSPGNPFRTAVAVAGPDRPGVVGYASYGPYRDDAHPDRLDPAVGELLAIYVDPAHQRIGAGRALLATVVSALHTGGAGQARLWVLADNAPARRFYERHDWAPDGVTQEFRVHRPDGTPVDLPEVRYARPVP